MGYTLDDFLRDTAPRQRTDSVWSVPDLYPKPGHTRILILSEFTEEASEPVPPIEKFFEYRSADYPNGRDYTWLPGSPVHPDFHFNKMDPATVDVERAPGKAGLALRVGCYIFNIDAWNVLIAKKEPTNEMQQEYLKDTKLRERADSGNFTGVQRFVMKAYVQSDFNKIGHSLRSRAEQTGDPSVTLLRQYVFDLHRKEKDPNQGGGIPYFLILNDMIKYDALPEDLREAVRVGVEADLPTIAEYIKVKTYKPSDGETGTEDLPPEMSMKTLAMEAEARASEPAPVVTATPQEENGSESNEDGNGLGAGGHGKFSF